jgi:hypothetical protein
VPIIDLPDDELAAVAAAIRGVIEGDRYPHAPRLDPLRAAWRGSTQRQDQWLICNLVGTPYQVDGEAASQSQQAGAR